MTSFYIGVAIVVLLYVLYARVVFVKNRALEAAASVQVQLQMRRDLLPNMFTLARKFMDHEKALITELTALRSEAEKISAAVDAGALKKSMTLDSSIGRAVGRFFAVAENYPELKSQAPILQAQEACLDVESNIAAARRFYNAEAASLNTLCETWPTSWFAWAMEVTALPYFEATDEHVADPVLASDYLN